ncbi:MAG: transposase, partial [Bacteroidia bacterium]|nr:transposase [Bacteroidia bacterium]MBL7923957.1 transposase [Bacteroidia bacterium]
SEAWRMDYNNNRPHKALNYQSPKDLLKHAS